MKDKKEEIKEKLIDLVDKYFPKINPEGGNRGRGEALVIIGIALAELEKALSQKEKEVRQELKKKIPKMDYLKWELRKDLVGKYHTVDIEKATEKAKGWNACCQYLN